MHCIRSNTEPQCSFIVSCWAVIYIFSFYLYLYMHLYFFQPYFYSPKINCVLWTGKPIWKTTWSAAILTYGIVCLLNQKEYKLVSLGLISRVPTRRTFPAMRFCGCGLERGSAPQDSYLYWNTFAWCWYSHVFVCQQRLWQPCCIFLVCTLFLLLWIVCWVLLSYVKGFNLGKIVS